jgi:hypothetical protein
MKNKTNKILFVLGLSIFLYTLVRAFLLSFTYDEAESYLQYTRNSVFLNNDNQQMSANHHLLNNWLNIFTTKLWGVSELVLRIPSLFAHLLFLYFSAKLVKNFQNTSLAIASFLIINLNPYLLDFFSLSRGYALSIGLMMASIYYISVFIADGYKSKNALAAIVLGGLATLANFVLLNYFVVSFGLIVLFQFIVFNDTPNKKWSSFFKSILFPFIAFSVFLLFIIPVAIQLKNAGALYFGGNNSFWADTVFSIINCSLYSIHYNYLVPILAKVVVVFSVVCATVFFGVMYFKNRSNTNILFLGSLIFLLTMCSFSTIVQHFVLGTLYLVDRTAIFLVVIFNLVFVVFINECTKIKSNIAWTAYLASVFAIIHFVLAFNLSYVLEWRWDADIKQMIVDLDKVKVIPAEKNSISIAIPLEFESSINFYRAKDNRTWINTVDRFDWNDKRFDYLFLSPFEIQKINMDSIEIIKKYPQTGNILAKQKYPPNLTKVCFAYQHNFEKTPEKVYLIDEKTEYSKNITYTVNDSITPDKFAEVIFSATVKAKNDLKNDILIVLCFQNPKECYNWKGTNIIDFIAEKDVWTNVQYSIFVPKQCKQGDLITAYIWNLHKQHLLVKNMELKWLAKP